MLRQELTPKKTAGVLGALVLVCLLVFTGFRMMGTRAAQEEEKRTTWQRDREMGVPDLGLNANMSEAEKKAAKNEALEQQMTREREATAQPGY